MLPQYGYVNEKYNLPDADVDEMALIMHFPDDDENESEPKTLAFFTKIG